MKKILIALVATLVLAGACSRDGGESAAHEGTPEGLESFLSEVKTALADSDIEALHRLEPARCDEYSIDEVRDGFQAAQGLLLAFTGLTFSQFARDTEFAVIEFDEEKLTARVESVITGESAEALGADSGENEISEYRFEDGAWNSDEACLGAGLDSGFTESAGDFDDDSDFESLPEDFELAPANEVTAQRDRDESVDLAVGDSFTLPDGVVVTIRSIDVHPDYDAADTFQPTHIVDLRAENSTTEDSSIPSLALFCADIEWGGASSGEGDFNVYGDLPSGSFAEGTAALYLPEGDDGSFVTPCEDLVLRVSAFGFFSDGQPSTADYPAPLPG